MGISEIKMAPLEFPGLPAKLDVVIQTDFPSTAYLLQRIWRFNNQETNPESLINRIEVRQEKGFGISVEIFFNKLGHESMKKAFSSLKEAKFSEKPDECKLQLAGLKTVQTVLCLINQTHEFVGKAQEQMKAILMELGVTEIK